MHLLTDNENLSADEYAKACVLLADLRRLHLGARECLERRGLDAEIFLPGNIWDDFYSPNDFTDWTYDMVNFVKCVSPFLGFHQMMWARMDLQTAGPVERAFVLVPNYLLPEYERYLPEFHLVHNAASFVEMSLPQVACYFDVVGRLLAPDGVFHFVRGNPLADRHVDVLSAAIQRFPHNHIVYSDKHIAGHLVVEAPNTFIRR